LKKRYTLEDKEGRFMTAEYDEENNLLTVTTYLQPQPGVPVDEVLESAGFTILSKIGVKKPQLVQFPRKEE